MSNIVPAWAANHVYAIGARVSKLAISKAGLADMVVKAWNQAG